MLEFFDVQHDSDWFIEVRSYLSLWTDETDSGAAYSWRESSFVFHKWTDYSLRDRVNSHSHAGGIES